MGFWQNLADSYDKNAEALKSKYPLSSTTISNNSDMIVVIIIDGNGKFSVEKIEKAKKNSYGNEIVPVQHICIPVTEKSMGRASGIAPHPVFDQYEYLKGSGKKFDAYLLELEKFAKSEFATSQVKAIYEYVKQKTVENDLNDIKPKDKTNIIFKVEISGNPQTKLWEDENFFEAWNNYYFKQKEQIKSLDYITGDEKPTADFHPKKIVNSSANAKLISDNDKTNFTFRGKFENSSQAFSIGYESSQKAHQFLRFLINDRGGYPCGEQVILSFAISSTDDKLMQPPITDNSVWSFLQEQEFTKQTDSERQINLNAETGIDYAEALRKSLAGFGYSNTLTKHSKTAVIVLDAATTGRLAITFYRELNRNEYIENIADWHSACKWNQQYWNYKDKQYISYTGAPSIDRIIEAVYGKPRGSEDKNYIKIKKKARERLIRCIFDKAILPKDFVAAAVRRASNPLAVTINGKFDRKIFNQIVSTACALVRKENLQNIKKEVDKLSIEKDRNDRDYLYGRLLGAADKLEEYALYKKNNDRIVTAAIRHMQALAQRPFSAWQTIHSCLNPYIQKVKDSFAFNEIQDVKQLFKAGDYENNTPLNGSYLIGYYHERAYIDQLISDARTKNKSTNFNEKENENDGQENINEQN
ncbi:MAG TPA: type I-C CRISPR-associated protein Cas8c/Csd1 [bacterium]|nr:type I-C CRISPR-associated protein Cas8c/Csd1 [bacterium]